MAKLGYHDWKTKGLTDPVGEHFKINAMVSAWFVGREEGLTSELLHCLEVMQDALELRLSLALGLKTVVPFTIARNCDRYHDGAKCRVALHVDHVEGEVLFIMSPYLEEMLEWLIKELGGVLNRRRRDIRIDFVRRNTKTEPSATEVEGAPILHPDTRPVGRAALRLVTPTD